MDKWSRLSLIVVASLLLLLTLELFGSNLPSRASSTGPTRDPLDVVINEIAWAGTAASYADEWIELYNTTETTVTLNGWHLTSNDGMDLALTGEIGPKSYYLIERTNDETVSDIPGDLLTSFGSGGLSNEGESLTLKDDLGTTVDTANANGGDWPAPPDSSGNYTMERINPALPDSDDNWAANDGVITNGLDADGNPLNGTPTTRNSTLKADLRVVKIGPSEAVAGTRITYTLAITNTGIDTASQTLLTDTLPQELTFLSQSSTFPFTQTGILLRWDLGDVPSDTHHLITLVTSVDSDAAGRVRNLITATTTAPESALDDNSAAWETVIQGLDADLEVVKRGPETVKAGEFITYHLGLHNLGLLAATNTVLTDVLPSEVTFVAQDSAFDFAADGETLVWTVGTVNSGAAYTITLTGQVAESIPGGTLVGMQIQNRAVASTEEQESHTANNEDSWATVVEESGEAEILISGVFYSGAAEKEAIQLINVGTISSTLEGWSLCKVGSSCKLLPTITLKPNERAWIARNAATFSERFGHPPDYEAVEWIGFTDDGDEVMLQDNLGQSVDTLVYEDKGQAEYPGWTGAALQHWGSNEILYRTPDETTGLPIPDTNTAADWIQYSGDPVYGRRTLRPGWDFDPLFWPRKATEEATVIVGVAPDNAYTVITQTLMRATESISIELYALRHPGIVEILREKARAGVAVTVLLDGTQTAMAADDPRWLAELWACEEIESAGGECWFMISNTIPNRYHYIHAKFFVVDDEWIAVTSQNFSNSSMPADDKSNGTYGSRGTVIVTNAPAIVDRGAEIFALDLDPAHHADLLRWNTTSDPRYGPVNYTPPLTPFDAITYTVRFTEPLVLQGTFGFELFTAPEAALRQSDALLGLINRAGPGDNVYVEQLYEYLDWGADPVNDPNLRLKAYLDAAARGAKVQILLNSGDFGAKSYDQTNTSTITYVNTLARENGWNLLAAMGDPTEFGIHNKMVLVDLGAEGRYAHVGSINGSEGSNKVNREIALQVKSDAVYNYLKAVFAFDFWTSQPIYLPLIARNYTPPAPPEPPVSYLVISEVYYTPGGPSVGEEWVEIYNPTEQPVDLSQYKISEAESPDRFETSYRFPDGATLAPGEVVIVAVNALNVLEADYEIANTTADVPDMIRYTWGDPEASWQLRDAGDQVLLLGPDDSVVDVLVWGDALYPGTVPHPGVTQWSASLERHPPYYDTNDCSYDFRERYPPTPGGLSEVEPQ